MDQLETLRQSTAEDRRYLISDIDYWTEEAVHYSLHTAGVKLNRLAAPKPAHNAVSAKRSSGIRKSERKTACKLARRRPKPESGIELKNAPVSSRLRSSRNRRARAKGPC